MKKIICDCCEDIVRGDLWEVSWTDGKYCYSCAAFLEYDYAEGM